MKTYEKMLNKIESHLENEDITMKDSILVLRDRNGNKWNKNILNWYTKVWLDEHFYIQDIMVNGTTEDVLMLTSYKAQFDIEHPLLEEMSVKEVMEELERKMDVA